jgi:hypothetical protein
MKKIFIWLLSTLTYLYFYGKFVNYLGDLHFDDKLPEGVLILLVGIFLIPAWFGIRGIMTAISDKIKEND